MFLFSPLDLRTLSGAPEQELNLYTTFGKFAKRLMHVSADMPLWIIQLSVCEWRIYPAGQLTGSKLRNHGITVCVGHIKIYGLPDRNHTVPRPLQTPPRP